MLFRSAAPPEEVGMVLMMIFVAVFWLSNCKREINKIRTFCNLPPILQAMGCNPSKRKEFLGRGSDLTFNYNDHSISVSREKVVATIELDFYGQVRMGGVTQYQHNGKTYCIYGKRFESREDLPASPNETQIRQILDELIAAKQSWQATLTKLPNGKDVLLNGHNQLLIGLMLLAITAITTGYAFPDPKKGLVITLIGLGIIFGLMTKYVILNKWGKKVSAPD